MPKYRDGLMRFWNNHRVYERMTKATPPASSRPSTSETTNTACGWPSCPPTSRRRWLEQDGGIRLGAGRVIVEAEMP